MIKPIKLETKLLLFGVLMAFASCQKNNTAEDWQVYKTPYFQIEYPNEFEFVKKGQHNEKGEKMLQQASFFLYLNDSTSNENGFQTNINLLVQDLSDSTYDLSRFCKESEKQIINLIKNSSILESKTIKNYHRIKYKGDMDNRTLFFYQHYELKNNQAFILTFSSKANEAENYLPVIDSIFNSFKLK